MIPIVVDTDWPQRSPDFGSIRRSAQQWPDKPVRILVPVPPGGGTDIQARLLSTVFQKSMGQNFHHRQSHRRRRLDRRTSSRSESPPDGNTILFTSGSISVVVTLYAKRMKFNPLTDLAPISWLSSTPLVLSIHPSVPAKSPEGAGRPRQGQARQRSTPAAIPRAARAHLTAEMLNQVPGSSRQVITYRGGGPAVIALISGEIDYIFATAPSIMPHVKSGKAKALAVTTPKRSSAFPDVPTMNSIYPGFESDNWYAMFFPKGTPKPIIDKMNAEIKKALGADEVRKFMAQRSARYGREHARRADRDVQARHREIREGDSVRQHPARLARAHRCCIDFLHRALRGRRTEWRARPALCQFTCPARRGPVPQRFSTYSVEGIANDCRVKQRTYRKAAGAHQAQRARARDAAPADRDARAHHGAGRLRRRASSAPAAWSAPTPGSPMSARRP